MIYISFGGKQLLFGINYQLCGIMLYVHFFNLFLYPSDNIKCLSANRAFQIASNFLVANGLSSASNIKSQLPSNKKLNLNKLICSRYRNTGWLIGATPVQIISTAYSKALVSQSITLMELHCHYILFKLLLLK